MVVATATREVMMSDVGPGRAALSPATAVGGLQGTGDHRDRHRAAVRGERAGRALQRLADLAARHAADRLGARRRRPRPDAGHPAGRHRPVGGRRDLDGGRHRHPRPRRRRRQAAAGDPAGAGCSRSAAGLLNGVLVGVLRLNPIIATLGTNALLYGANLGISGRPAADHHARCSASVTGGTSAGIPNAVFFALAALVVVSVLVKAHGRRPAVRGRRGQPAGRPGRGSAGPRPPGRRPTSGRSCSTAWPASCSPASPPSRAPSRATASC